jgi:hypothetical protein
VREGDGEVFALNKNPTGETTLAGLIEKYRTKQPKWPVPLKEGVDAGGGGGGGGSDAPAPATAAAGGGGGDDKSEFFHGPIKKAAADELLTGSDGQFLIRSKGDSNTDFILSIVYKDAPTHHTLVRTGEGEVFALNKNPTGETTIAGVVEKYRTKQPKWPVPLKEGVSA